MFELTRKYNKNKIKRISIINEAIQSNCLLNYFFFEKKLATDLSKTRNKITKSILSMNGFNFKPSLKRKLNTDLQNPNAICEFYKFQIILIFKIYQNRLIY